MRMYDVKGWLPGQRGVKVTHIRDLAVSRKLISSAPFFFLGLSDISKKGLGRTLSPACNTAAQQRVG